MTVDELSEFLESHNDEYAEFDRVTNKLSNRPDLHAFLLLDKLCPGNTDMVSAASHDEICLCVDPDQLCKYASDEEIIDLHRCGVRYDQSTDSLCMFV